MPTAPDAILPTAAGAGTPDEPIVVLAETGAGSPPSSPAAALGAAAGAGAPDDPLPILDEAGDAGAPSAPEVAMASGAGSSLSTVALAGSLTDDGSPVVLPDLIYAGEVASNQFAWTSTGSWPRPTSGTYYEVIVLQGSEAATMRKYVDATIAAAWANLSIGPGRTDPDGVVFTPASTAYGAGGSATASLTTGPESPEIVLPPATDGEAPDSPETILASISGVSAPTAPQPILGVPLHGVYDTDGAALTDTDGAILTN